MIKTIDGWETDTPTARHPWLMSCYVRLACAHRHGCITKADYQRARRVIDERFDWLTRNTDPKREPREYEISGTATSALEWGITKRPQDRRPDPQPSSADTATATASAPLPPHNAFWTATPELTLIREWARDAIGPWGLLGVVMARVVATIPPTAQIPPYTGSALAEPVHQPGRQSGYFKGATIGAARDAVQIGYVYATGPGSGEGINHLFAYYDRAAKSHRVQTAQRVLLGSRGRHPGRPRQTQRLHPAVPTMQSLVR